MTFIENNQTNKYQKDKPANIYMSHKYIYVKRASYIILDYQKDLTPKYSKNQVLSSICYISNKQFF